jgi:hypothetical protein
MKTQEATEKQIALSIAATEITHTSMLGLEQ